MDKYKVVWTEKALSDMSQCISFVLSVSAEAALELRNDFKKTADSLNVFPERNPIFEMPKAFPYVVRKQIVKDRYILLYTVEKNDVFIYRVLDARRKFDQLLK